MEGWLSDFKAKRYEMRITITINKRTAKHLEDGHDWYDCCGETEIVMKKIQKQIQLSKQPRRTAKR